MDEPRIGEAAEAAAEQAPEARGPSPIERLASFRFTYVAIFVFLVAYISSVEGLEAGAEFQIRRELSEAVAVEPGPSVPTRIQQAVAGVVRESTWTRLGVRIRPIVVGADGYTLLYAGAVAPLPALSDHTADSLLPAVVDVDVAVGFNSLLANLVLVAYGALLMTTLYLYTRYWTRRAEARLADVSEARDQSSERAGRIGVELEEVRERLAAVEPEKESFAEEIRALEDERRGLLARLEGLAEREGMLRSQSSSAHQELQDERRALEELLEEAVHDVEQRDEEIRSLQKQVRRAGKERGRESELLGRRLRTLYEQLEVDDRALDELASLGDEGLRLKAEAALKRLSDEPEAAAVRRKVGGLPPHLSVFELGFAGKGRIYYTRGKSRRHRILLVGAKNRQKQDLEYLSRLPKGT